MARSSHPTVNRLYLLLVACLLVAIPVLSHAQTPSQHFLDIFERETRGQGQEVRFGDFRNVERISFFPDTLPAWFFQPPQAYGNRIFAVGISDPDLPEEEALFQAFYRAKMLAVLFHQTRIEYFRDIFTSTRDDQPRGAHRQRFDTFFRLSSAVNADGSQFEIIEHHFTRFNESLVLIAYHTGLEDSEKTGNNPETLSASATVLYIEAHMGDIYEPQATFDLVSELSIPMHYPVSAGFYSTRKGNREAIRSVFNEEEIRYPAFVYRYTNPSWEPHSRPFVSYHGLWGAYIQQLLEHLTLATEQTTLRLKSLGQDTESASTEMAREVAALNARLIMNHVELFPDRFGFDLDIKPIEP